MGGLDLALDLDELLANRRGHRSDSSEARQKENRYRSSMATNWALAALRRLHQDDFDELFRQAKVKVEAERGPLPA